MTAPDSKADTTMGRCEAVEEVRAWHGRSRGRYFENYTCEAVRPRTASVALGADNDCCRVILAFHVDKCDVDGVGVSGLALAAVAESPKYVDEGNWRLGVLIDESASGVQAEKLEAVFSGQLGARHQDSTPVNWKQGEVVIIAGSVSDEQAKEIFGHWEAPKPYIRNLPQP